MDPQTILYIILAIVIASYLFEQILEWLNLRAERREIPGEVAAFFEKERYLKALDYHREQTRFSFVTSAFGFLLTAGLLVTGGFGWLDSMLRGFVENEIELALVFFGALVLASDL